MRKSNRLTRISNLDDFKLDAIATIWQFDKEVHARLEKFISERFKYPKGGGWDLDSLREDILFQNDIEFTDEIITLLPDEIAHNRGASFQKGSAIELINQELFERYKPNLSSPKDHQIIQEISQVIYAMEAVRLGLLGDQVKKETPPSNVNDNF